MIKISLNNLKSEKSCQKCPATKLLKRIFQKRSYIYFWTRLQFACINLHFSMHLLLVILYFIRTRPHIHTCLSSSDLVAASMLKNLQSNFSYLYQSPNKCKIGNIEEDEEYTVIIGTEVDLVLFQIQKSLDLYKRHFQNYYFLDNFFFISLSRMFIIEQV